MIDRNISVLSPHNTIAIFFIRLECNLRKRRSALVDMYVPI